MPAWIEFLHRETRRGQLAFLMAVRATVPPPPGAAAASSSLSPPPREIQSRPSSATPPASSPAAADGAAVSPEAPSRAKAALAAASDGTAGAAWPTKQGAAAAAGASGRDGAAAGGAGSAAEVGGVSFASAPQQTSRPPPASPPAARPPAWSCVRTNRDLEGAVQAYRESLGAASTSAAGSWQPKARPRIIRHMGIADQVRWGKERFFGLDMRRSRASCHVFARPFVGIFEAASPLRCAVTDLMLHRERDAISADRQHEQRSMPGWLTHSTRVTPPVVHTFVVSDRNYVRSFNTLPAFCSISLLL